LKMAWNEYFESVIGLQNTTYKDNSADVYGMTDEAVSSTGIYLDLRMHADFLEGTNLSVAGRQDFNDNYEDEFIWKYGLKQNFARGFYLRSNGGTSYSNPTLIEAGMRAGLVTNPELETQQVETYSLGFGVNGDALGGTFNIDLGFFD